MTNFMEKIKPYGLVVARLGMGVVFLCFSYYQFSNPLMWTSFVPHAVSAVFGGNAYLLVVLNAWFELVAGIALIVGIQTRTVALLLSLHLFGIAGSIGISPLGVRDIGLAIATFAIFLNGPDIWSLDSRSFARRSSVSNLKSTRSEGNPLPVRRI